MLLKVQELVARQQPVDLQGALDLTELFRDNPEYRPLAPMQYDVKAKAADDRIVVSGQLSCDVGMRCSRCLETIEETIRVPFEETFRVVGEDAEADEEDDEAVPVKEERIDLAPYLLEEFVVQLPYAPLCKEDCQGLCPECGTNLNEQSCGCQTEKIDPRMAALQDWFKSQKD
ncbi:YceD family protein [Cohnella boryungensis]|uniref:YceD family protein n=1 Tax=Cohnella boryungensis TaxID=768479 RepID=A0ABV8SEE0_9BACL